MARKFLPVSKKIWEKFNKGEQELFRVIQRDISDEFIKMQKDGIDYDVFIHNAALLALWRSQSWFFSEKPFGGKPLPNKLIREKRLKEFKK